MATLELLPRNDVLRINRPGGTSHLTTEGSDWLWAVTAVYGTVFLVNWLSGFRPRHGEKIFHYVFSLALLVGVISYFAMASDMGWVVVNVVTKTKKAKAVTFQLFWPKYVNWAVTWPSLIVALGLLSGQSWASMAYGVSLSWIWTGSWLASGLSISSFKWGFFVLGSVSWLLLMIHMLTDGRRSAAQVGSQRDYTILTGWLCLLWVLYPLAVGLSDCSKQISVTHSFIFFGILDLLALPLISLAFLVLSRRWDFESLGLQFTQYGRLGISGATNPGKDMTAGMDPGLHKLATEQQYV